jgi:hypothetical protein
VRDLGFDEEATMRLRIAVLVAGVVVGMVAVPSRASAVPGIVVVQQASASSSATAQTAVAKCPVNTVVIGGGGDLTDGGASVRIVRSGPMNNDWVVAAREVSAGYLGTWSVRAWAVCAKKPKGYVVVSAKQDFTTSGVLSVSCPAGKKVLGVGGAASLANGHAVLDTLRPTLDLSGAYVEAFTDAPAVGEPLFMLGHAICATPSGLGLQLAYASSSTSSNDYRTISVGCPPGTDLHGMGASVNGAQGGAHIDGITPFSLGAYAVAREKPTGYWGQWNLDVFAICAA